MTLADICLLRESFYFDAPARQWRDMRKACVYALSALFPCYLTRFFCFDDLLFCAITSDKKNCKKSTLNYKIKASLTTF